MRTITAPSQTKLAQPRSSGWLARPALERRLDEAFAKRLTTLTADAGFGKTTLLSEWATDVECGWYTVTARATDLSSFAGGVAARDPVASPAARGGSRSQRASQAAPSTTSCSTRMLSRARSATRSTSCLAHDVVLVLDDVHELASAASARFLESLCRQAPAMLHLVLASRAEPPFAVDRLRGQGQVLELSAADLAFDPAEIEALLGARLGNGDAELAAALHATDRRLAGARPARGRHPRGRSPLTARAEAFEQLRGGGDAMFAYLAREVFERESPDVQQLLRTAALLDRFTPELCEALGVPRAGKTLAELTRRGFFVQRQDDYFSLHALIRDFALRTWPWPPEEAEPC